MKQGKTGKRGSEGEQGEAISLWLSQRFGVHNNDGSFLRLMPKRMVSIPSLPPIGTCRVKKTSWTTKYAASFSLFFGSFRSLMTMFDHVWPSLTIVDSTFSALLHLPSPGHNFICFLSSFFAYSWCFDRSWFPLTFVDLRWLSSFRDCLRLSFILLSLYNFFELTFPSLTLADPAA